MSRQLSWVAPPHLFKKGRIIVLYVGEHEAVPRVLEQVLGQQFAGGRALTGTAYLVRAGTAGPPAGAGLSTSAAGPASD